MSTIRELTCPYINKIKAAVLNTNYYCDFDHMEFEEMSSHCKHCEMYENLMKKAAQILNEEYYHNLDDKEEHEDG